MTKYAVIEAKTRRQVVSGLSLDEASRLCKSWPGHYFVPLSV